jgi:hypothetical protein
MPQLEQEFTRQREAEEKAKKAEKERAEKERQESRKREEIQRITEQRRREDERTRRNQERGQYGDTNMLQVPHQGAMEEERYARDTGIFSVRDHNLQYN